MHESSTEMEGQQAHLNSSYTDYWKLQAPLGNPERAKRNDSQNSPTKDKQQPGVTKIWELYAWKREVLRTDLGW